MNPPVLIPPHRPSRLSLACGACGEPISSASPIVMIEDRSLGRILSVKVCWDCSTLHVESPEALQVQFEIYRRR